MSTILHSPARALPCASTPTTPCRLMPAAEALSLSYALLTFTSLIPLGVVVTAPTSSDAWALAGASMAALLSGLYSLSKRRGYWVLALNVLSSASVGTLGPGLALWCVAMVHDGTHQHLSSSMTWEVWTGGGLFCGLGGWAMVHSVMLQWDKHSDRVASRPFAMFDDGSTYREDEDP